MKRCCQIFFMCFCILNTLSAQNEKEVFKGTFWNEEHRIRIVLNLYEETVSVPGYDFFGQTNGYIGGNIYGVWLLTSFQMENETTAKLRFSDDRGADSQTILLKQQPDSTFTYEAINGNAIRKVSGRKLVKVPGSLTFKRR